MADLDINNDGTVSPAEKAADTNKNNSLEPNELASYAEQQSAYDVVVNMFNNVGAPELGQWLAQAIKGDPSLLDKQNELFSMLQDSDPYKKRFGGLVQLRDYNKKNPTNPVYVPSEAQYLATETQMKDILKPVSDMYKDNINTVVANLIGNQISPAELQTRVVIANNWVMNTDPNVKNALREYYGIDDSHLLGYALDPETGTAQIQKVAGAAELGAQALSSQVQLTAQESESLLKQLTSSGQAPDMLAAGQMAAGKLQDITAGISTSYNPNAGTLVGTQRLAGIEGTKLGTAEVLGAALGVDTAAATKVAGLKSRERARFEGTSGGTNVLQEQVSGTV
ncbi:MAG: hypothetical protein EBT07_04820 [Actinobacteria bacterium]|nr:hypothetical protein [Actinomycetota bacterium]